jgi:hypothetical protein
VNYGLLWEKDAASGCVFLIPQGTFLFVVAQHVIRARVDF